MHQEFALNNMIAKYNLINRKLQDKINALIDDIVITEEIKYSMESYNNIQWSKSNSPQKEATIIGLNLKIHQH